MTQGELIALIAARPASFAWLIGAGASRMSGLPTANDIVADLKRQYYAQEEGVEISLQDMHNDAVRSRIQTFMDARGFPAQWSAEEYSGYFDKIFGADKERQRSYISRKLSEDKVNLSAGNRVQAAMLAAGLTRVIFTTNFDPVVERAYADVSSRSLSAYHLEGSHAALQALNEEDYPLYVKLHGDFRYDSIKNLTADLAAQNDDLAKCLVAAASRFGLVVAGYSGRDESILALIREAMDQPNPFPAGLFWTTIQGAPVLPSVQSLIDDAQSKSIRSGVIEIETYDTLMLRIWRNLEGKPASLDAKVRRSASSMVSIPLPASKGGSPLPAHERTPSPRAADGSTCGDDEASDRLEDAAGSAAEGRQPNPSHEGRAGYGMGRSPGCAGSFRRRLRVGGTGLPVDDCRRSRPAPRSGISRGGPGLGAGSRAPAGSEELAPWQRSHRGSKSAGSDRTGAGESEGRERGRSHPQAHDAGDG